MIYVVVSQLGGFEGVVRRLAMLAKGHSSGGCLACFAVRSLVGWDAGRVQLKLTAPGRCKTNKCQILLECQILMGEYRGV